MRRIVFLLIFLILMGVGVWWFFLRLTPEKALRAAFNNLSNIQTIQNVQGSLFWVLQGPGNQGLVLDKWISFAGSLDLRDPSRVQAIGTIGLSRAGSVEDFQSLDLILLEDRIAFKLQEVNEDTKQMYIDYVGTSTKNQWFDFDRNIYLEKRLSPNWNAIGNGKDVRSAIRGVELDTWAVPGSSNVREVDGRRIMEMKLTTIKGPIEDGLISLVAAWHLRDPNDMEINWASRAVKGIVKGDWYVTIDIETRQFHKIQGTWPLLSEEGKEIGRVTMEIWMSEFNKSFKIQEPEDTVDITKSIDDVCQRSFTPAEERVIPPPEPVDEIDEETATSTEDENVGATRESPDQEEDQPEEPIDEETATSTEE